MSAQTANIARQMDTFRKTQSGQPVLFGGKTYYARIEPVSGAKVGETGLPASVRALFQQYIASTDPVVMLFSPADFRSDARPDLPLAPMEGDLITAGGMVYQVTAFTFDNAGGAFGDTLALPIFCLRAIYI